ncbi:Apoptosis-linked interacting protein [Trichinella pseudospiralis]|uniref:Apoptosis-linked interacting protein n=1 Tax=Trichinella pseudospiralis TaxID=6337 RepID=A0A0V1J142_TRIPS|nr:Apoptosis-linked interacting protein [Trichinella pseudospiralis]KRZ28669.1 Apoptosis-linked interacting protein [Trichinella pseudospiralis]
MSRLLAVPLKKSSEVDMAGPLHTYISSTYSTDECPTDSCAIEEFNKLRNKVCCGPLDKQESSLQQLYRYYDQLVCIEGKLPLTPTEIPIPFKWKEAFERSLFGRASLTISSGSYEKACVLFNIAAMQSQVAAMQRLDDDDDLKLAARLFQQSAGIFAYLKDTVMSLVGQEPTIDMMPNTLAILSALMLAQAQEIFFLKASKDHNKPAVIAKIAAECAAMYYEVNKMLSKDNIKNLWEKAYLMSGKCFTFQALAQYYQSLLAKEAKEIGEELARLQYADELMVMAQEKLGPYANLLQTEADLIHKAYLAAKKDNDFIYHERIPNIKAVPPIGKLAIAKITPLSHPLSAKPHKDIFEKLVPVAVQQALACYEVRRGEIVNAEIAKLREETNKLNELLTMVNLPTSLEDVCNADKVPPSIRQKSAKVISLGGVEALRRGVDSLPVHYRRNQEILDEAVRLLNEEKESDDQLRLQFKEKWTRMASEKLTEPLLQEIRKIEEVLESAKKADETIRQKLQTHSAGIETLSKVESDLCSTIPGLVDTFALPNSPIIKKLKELLAMTDKIKKDRSDLEVQFKNATCDMKPVFMQALLRSDFINEEELSKDKLDECFASLRKAANGTIEMQEKVSHQILDAVDKFVQEKGSLVNSDRENVLRSLTKAYDAYLELNANVTEGTKFYSDMTPLILRLQQKVSDFCFARKTEKEDLMRDLQKNIINDVKEMPEKPPRRPPRPPPPSVATAQASDEVKLANAPNLQSAALNQAAAAQYMPYPFGMLKPPNVLANVPYYPTYPGGVSRQQTPYPVTISYPYPSGPVAPQYQHTMQPPAPAAPNYSGQQQW